MCERGVYCVIQLVVVWHGGSQRDLLKMTKERCFRYHVFTIQVYSGKVQMESALEERM